MGGNTLDQEVWFGEEPLATIRYPSIYFDKRYKPDVIMHTLWLIGDVGLRSCQDSSINEGFRKGEKRVER